MSEPLLSVKNLSVDFHTARGTVNAVKNVSWSVSRGETLAILGESGSGKSVSANAVMNLLDIPPAEIVSGEIIYDGEDLLKISYEKHRALNGKKIAMIFQDPLGHLNPVYTVGWQIIEMMTAHGRPADMARARALELITRVGMPEPEQAMHKYPHQFSGGQRQRLMIAMALMLKPDILIADEPTTALDVTIQAEVLTLLKELQAETGMALVLITHDLGVVAEIADRVVVMNKGEIVETGTARDVYHSPQHAYTKKLIAAAPGKGAIKQTDEAAPLLLEAKKLCKTYGKFAALKDVSLTLARGQSLAVVGESGSGKSTLARTILRLEDADSGEALWKGRDLIRMNARDLLGCRREIQMVFQDPTQSLNPRMSVYQLIAEGWDIHKLMPEKAKRRARVIELLEQVGLSAEHVDRYPHQFSGGQRQRIAIARALALEPELIICDEAVSALDVSIQAQVIALLDKLREELGISFLFIAHDLGVVRDFADTVIVMKSGEIVERGPAGQIFDNPQHAYTQRLLAANLDPDPDVQASRRAGLDHG
ncbi:peptide/nickel transport system ATP-binding protein [Devosia lucknowensis]|uniref:Peptide/nickel transport system ATP-binding protein n=1 Tax=Devosia lucknowensis TaxID=1096929 RepID=A0A1Y6F9Z3_9HYPH|nr:ABC transporter ATP-binding protein [Devosia lucknowensis]SMQ69203.1 peptide/nickel transport system ATP-binding protein [Devosia lucknowensis]